MSGELYPGPSFCRTHDWKWKQRGPQRCPGCEVERYDRADRKVGELGDLAEGLTGTSPQIAWAAEIRRTARANLDRLSATPEARAYLDQSASKWWIDRRREVDPPRELERLIRALAGDASFPVQMSDLKGSSR